MEKNKFKTVEDFKAASRNWIDTCPFRNGVSINGEKIEMLYNFILTYKDGDNLSIINSSSAQDVRPSTLHAFYEAQQRKIKENVLRHLKSVEDEDENLEQTSTETTV